MLLRCYVMSLDLCDMYRNNRLLFNVCLFNFAIFTSVAHGCQCHIIIVVVYFIYFVIVSIVVCRVIAALSNSMQRQLCLGIFKSIRFMYLL